MFQNISDLAKRTPLQEFYSKQCLFITGGTGFLGKLLIEKLLRSCPDVSTIYVLIRPKTGKNVQDRINQLLQGSIFALVREMYPDLNTKVIGISGDCTVNNLGLSADDRKLLTEKINIVFHAAATIRFDEPLTDAIEINLKGTSYIVDLCKNMKNLKSFIHVSTAYTNCYIKNIDEKFYDHSVRYEDILKLGITFTKDEINKSTTKLISQWPNTYAFTKALAEDLIKDKNENLPTGIFRPGIVLPTLNEPFPGWTDEFYGGPTKAVFKAISDSWRVLKGDPNAIFNLIPVDLTVNAMIACAQDVVLKKIKKSDEILIYNYVSTADTPIKLGRFFDLVQDNARQYPSENSSWYYILFFEKNELLFRFYDLMLQWIPMTIEDFYAILTGKRPKKSHMRIHRFINTITYFCSNSWLYKNDNVKNMWKQLNSRDQEIFYFSMENFDWEIFINRYVKGIDKYLFKNKITSEEDYKVRSKRLYKNHQLFIITLVILICSFLWALFTTVFV